MKLRRFDLFLSKTCIFALVSKFLAKKKKKSEVLLSLCGKGLRVIATQQGVTFLVYMKGSCISLCLSEF